MDRRMTFLILAILVFAPVAATLASDCSDGATEVRTSNQYVLYAQFTTNEDLGSWSFHSNCLYFIDGSANDAKMESYLKDSSVNITADDRDAIVARGTGTVVNVYDLSNYYYSDQTIYFNDSQKKAKLVLEPYNELSFFVKAGDTINLSINSAVDNMGDKVSAYYYLNYSTVYIDGPVEMSFKTSSIFKVELNLNGLYADVSYSVFGNSEPSGSATTYVVICSAITVLMLLVLVLASLKPRWSK